MQKSIFKDIDSFIDRIEQCTQKLENSLNGNNLTDFMRELEIIQTMLKLVYAKWHEADGNALLRVARNEGLGECRQLLKQFVSNLLSLSIEMQKAQNQSKTSSAHVYSEIEKHEEIANNLAAIGKLVHIAEYDKAMSIISAMQENRLLCVPDGRVTEMVRMIKTHDYKGAIEITGTLHKEYIDRIKRNGGNAAETQKNILAVDDRPEILTNVSSALSDYYKVFGAPGGHAALQIIQKIKIDLFILDIDMPGMNGFELTEKIRAEERYEQTPIMFLTATSSRERILKSMQLGIKDFIVKPAYNETLLAKVGKYLIP